MQSIYHISYDKLGLHSDQDYAEFYLALACFGEQVPTYQNLEGVDYVASTYAGRYDTIITREGISWVATAPEPTPALKDLLTTVVTRSEFPDERFEEIREDYLGEIDTTFQVLCNAFASEHLEDYLYPSLPLEECVLLSTRAGVRAKFDLLRLTSKDYADLTYSAGQTYAVPGLHATRIHRSEVEPEHLTRLLVFQVDGYISWAMRQGLRRLMYTRTHYPVPIKSLYLGEQSYLYLHVHPGVDEAQLSSIVHEYLRLSHHQKVLLAPTDLVRR